MPRAQFLRIQRSQAPTDTCGSCTPALWSQGWAGGEGPLLMLDIFLPRKLPDRGCRRASSRCTFSLVLLAHCAVMESLHTSSFSF